MGLPSGIKSLPDKASKSKFEYKFCLMMIKSMFYILDLKQEAIIEMTFKHR